MNCQDIARILDDQDISRLAEKEQQAVKLHLASCHECAHDWEVHVQLSASALPAMSQDLQARCRTLVVGAAGSGSRVRARSRLLLASTLLVVAAAAAMVGVRLAERTRGQASVAAPVIAAPATPAPQSMVEARGPEEVGQSSTPSTAAPRAKDETSNLFTVFVMPLREESGDPAIKEAAEAYYSAVLDELHALPNLVLVAYPGAPASGIPADYSLTITSRRTEEHETAPVDDASANTNAENATLGPQPGRWRVDIRVVWRSPQVPRAFITSAAGLVSDSAIMAANSVDLLHKRVFPADPFVRQTLHVQLRDSGLPATLRLRALSELRALIDSGRGSGWESSDVRAVMDYIRSIDPSSRATALRALRGVRHPDLAQPLVDLMRLDADEDVRLEAATTLTQDFARDPAVRAALDAAARNDSRQLVRNVAQRGLSGEAGWHEYVVATLKDSNLKDTARIEPLTYVARTLTRTGLQSAPPASLRAMYGDDVMAGLDELLPGLIIDTAQVRAADDLGMLMNTLGQAEHPAVKDLLLKVLHTSRERMLRRMSGNILATRFRDEPGVRQALEEAVANHPELREMVEFYDRDAEQGGEASR